MCRRKVVAQGLAGGITFDGGNSAVMIGVEAVEPGEAPLHEIRASNGLISASGGGTAHLGSLASPVEATLLCCVEFLLADRPIAIGIEPGE
ncbi:MAG: hypothetical protein BGP16_17020 [Sphingobium sp. 66-54]|nr:MAG: hypothetical protein BGP16_17020 [Sphingobium sp. 66-54]